MRHWLTMHYPKVEDGSDHYPLRVWLQDGTESAGAKLAAGDLVLVYETKGGPARWVRSANGVMRKVPVKAGRQGIIAIARATGPFKKDVSFEKFSYEDGNTRWWCWHAPLELLQSGGEVPLAEVNRVLGFSPGYRFRGFGALHSGLKEITSSEYATLAELFKASAKRN